MVMCKTQSLIGDLRCEFASWRNNECPDLFTSEDPPNTSLHVFVRNESCVLDGLPSRFFNGLEARFDSGYEEGERFACACAGFYE